MRNVIDPRRKQEIKMQIQFYDDAYYVLDDQTALTEDYKAYIKKRIQELEMELHNI